MSLLDGKGIRDWCRQRFQSKDDMISTVEGVTENTEEGKNVDALVIKEVFQSVSDGKALLASAITDKGIETDAADSFAVMAGNIGRIVTEGGGDAGAIKVQSISFSIAATASNRVLDLTQYSANYGNLKLNENIFVCFDSIYFTQQVTHSKGWRGIAGTSYDASTGKLGIGTYSGNLSFGTSGWVYIVETG